MKLKKTNNRQEIAKQQSNPLFPQPIDSNK